MQEVYLRVHREVVPALITFSSRERASDGHDDHLYWQAIGEQSSWYLTWAQEQRWMDPDRGCGTLG